MLDCLQHVVRLCGGEYIRFVSQSLFDPIDKGGLKLELQFGSALTQAVNIFVHAKYNNLIETNRSREVIHHLLN